MMRYVKLLAGLVFFGALGVILHFKWGLLASEVDMTVNGPRTVAQRVNEYGVVVKTRLQPDFDKAGLSYPPNGITLVILKQERLVELYARSDNSDGYRYIRTFPILAASGRLGPKLQEGDEQVPEGIYGVESLNPNSHYHVALHVDYPNSFDREKAKADGRTDLGGDIMIHGSNVSIGCVAMGDVTAEDLFVLSALVGIKNVQLIFCPLDFRLTKDRPAGAGLPSWAQELYNNLERRLGELPLPPQSSTQR